MFASSFRPTVLFKRLRDNIGMPLIFFFFFSPPARQLNRFSPSKTSYGGGTGSILGSKREREHCSIFVQLPERTSRGPNRMELEYFFLSSSGENLVVMVV